MRSRIAFAFVFAAAFILSSCATTRKAETPAAEPVATKTVKKSHVNLKGGGTFKIEKGQTLWGIAKSDAAYAKACEWPILYKANTTVIQDPDLIYPGQMITIPKDVPAAEGENACKASGKYGKYEPHSKPRTDVKIDF